VEWVQGAATLFGPFFGSLDSFSLDGPWQDSVLGGTFSFYRLESALMDLREFVNFC